MKLRWIPGRRQKYLIERVWSRRRAGYRTVWMGGMESVLTGDRREGASAVDDAGCTARRPTQACPAVCEQAFSTACSGEGSEYALEIQPLAPPQQMGGEKSGRVLCLAARSVIITSFLPLFCFAGGVLSTAAGGARDAVKSGVPHGGPGCSHRGGRFSPESGRFFPEGEPGQPAHCRLAGWDGESTNRFGH